VTQQPSPQAIRQRRYRQRLRGERIAKRNPGRPKKLDLPLTRRWLRAGIRVVLSPELHTILKQLGLPAPKSRRDAMRIIATQLRRLSRSDADLEELIDRLLRYQRKGVTILPVRKKRHASVPQSQRRAKSALNKRG